MLEASFERAKNRSAMVSNAYQYDTGQRIRLRGLPSPQELAERDDLLSGDEVVVQGQFSYRGDSQSEMRLARWEEREDVWLLPVPDIYLTRNAEVQVHIYVTYGSDENTTRAKTMYEAVFTPIGRPAPSANVTPEQKNQWDVLVEEIDLTIAQAEQAASAANGMAEMAREAAEQADAMTRSANQAMQNANLAAQHAEDGAQEAREAAQVLHSEWENVVMECSTLEAESDATASTRVDENGVRHIALGIPKGRDGNAAWEDIVLTMSEMTHVSQSRSPRNIYKYTVTAPEGMHIDRAQCEIQCSWNARYPCSAGVANTDDVDSEIGTNGNYSALRAEVTNSYNSMVLCGEMHYLDELACYGTGYYGNSMVVTPGRTSFSNVVNSAGRFAQEYAGHNSNKKLSVYVGADTSINFVYAHIRLAYLRD